MKKIILVLVALVFLSFTKTEADKIQLKAGTEISEKDDKKFLLDYFRETGDNLQKQVGGLNAKQMQYKPSEGEWSVSQILEHIILTEEMLFGMLKEQMLQPANPERKPEIILSDDDIQKAIVDRSHKATAPKELEGKGEYTNPEKALEALALQRKLILDYIQTTPVEEMRNRINDSPMGPVDAYQFFLFIAGHTARHTLQISEVVTSSEFPKQ